MHILREKVVVLWFLQYKRLGCVASRTKVVTSDVNREEWFHEWG